MKSLLTGWMLIAVCLNVGVTGCGKKETPVEPPAIVSKDRPAPPKVEPEPPKVAPKIEDTGTVKVEFDVAVDPRSVITIGGSEYTAKDLEKEITLKTGKHIIAVKQAGLGVTPREITVEKGQRRIVRIYEPNRRAAEWAFQRGAQLVHIKVDGQERPVKSVAELPPTPFKVVWIRFMDKPLNDADFEHVEGLDSLHSLQLARTPITDGGLAHLRGLPVLDHLILDTTRITDAGLLLLKDLPKLRFLDLVGTKITDAGLANLKGMELTGLRLDQTAVTDAGLAHLSGMVNLDLLNLSGTQITDAGLEHLQGMRKLRDLGLGKTKVTDAGLAKLKSFPRLSLLYVRSTAVTDAGVADLVKTLPKCKVSR